MRAFRTLLAAFIVANAGCSSQPRREAEAQPHWHAVLADLTVRDRNAVHVVLWTLQANGVPITPEVRLDLAYSQTLPQIQLLRQRLRSLPEEKLNELDWSLAYHWRIYSPIWSSHDWQ